MFCSKCGNKIYDDTGVCRYCGEKYKKKRAKDDETVENNKQSAGGETSEKPKFLIKADIFIIILSALFVIGAITIIIVQFLGREFYFPYAAFLFSAALILPGIYFSLRWFLYYFKNGGNYYRGRNFWNPYPNQSTTNTSGIPGTVNYQNFENIKIGMSIVEVKSFLGAGKEVFNSRTNGIEILTIMWQDNAVYPLAFIAAMPKSITVKFENGIVAEKNQMGL